MDSKLNLTEWNVEDEAFWESKGKDIASKNLWASIPNLLCGLAVWLYWSSITVQMLNFGFPFEKAQLFTLMARGNEAEKPINEPNVMV